jgi:hypothetical protein
VKRIDNPYDLVEPKTKIQWHSYWVFEDKEFISDVSNYQKHLKKLYELRKNVHGFNNDEWRIKHMDYMLDEKKRICAKYEIEGGDFLLYKSRNDKHPLHESYGLFSTFTDIRKSEVDGGIEVRFKPDISKSEYLEAWKDIKAFADFEPSYHKVRSKISKRKEEIDYQLIYAISRARYKGMSYPAIHKLYTLGKLQNYKTRAGKRFKTSKELNDYYLRNSAVK